MSKKIEVEGGELVLQSEEGHYAIIPSKDRTKLLKLVKDECDDCINSYIKSLPLNKDYAKDGTIITEKDLPEKRNLFDPMDVPFKTETSESTSNAFSDLYKIQEKNIEKEKVKKEYNQFKDNQYRENFKNYQNNIKDVDLNNVTSLKNLSKTEIEAVQKKLIESNYLKSSKNTLNPKNEEEITKAQELLLKKGYNLGNYGKNKDGVDGKKGKLTNAALEEFNKDDKEIDGIVGNKTSQAFKNYQLEKYNKNDLKFDLKGKTEPEIQKELQKNDFFKAKLSDFNVNSDNILLRNVDNSFKPTLEKKCTSKGCSYFVGQEIQNKIKVKGREEVGAYGDAWTINENLKASGAKEIYNVFPNIKAKISDPDAYVKNLTKNAPNIKEEQIESGDVINMYYGGSKYAKRAHKEGGSVFSTHLGIVKEENGEKYVEHNVGGSIKKVKLAEMLSNTLVNGANKPLRITAITRPKYNLNKSAEVYEPTQTSINFNTVSNMKTSLGSKESAIFTQTLVNNRDVILKDIPLQETDFNELVKASRILAFKESNNKSNPKTDKINILAGIRENFVPKILGGRESSEGFTQMKDKENIDKTIRDNLGINNESLKTPEGSAIATMYALSSKYLKIKNSVDSDIKLVPNELSQLAIIAWNEPVDKVIATINKYKTVEKAIQAYRDDYGYNERGETKFPYDLAITAFKDYIK